jgi:HSP20 family protein
MASKMADKVADTFSGGSGTFSQTMNKMAEKVSDKLSGSSDRSSEDRSSSSYGRDSDRTSTTSSAYSGNSRSPAYESGRSYESSGEGGRSFAESGRSSEGSGESFGRMADKAADRVSSAAERASESARSGIGETLHKISDKISETFSGRSSGDNAESRMMRSSPRRGRDSNSSVFNPFDLSSIFKGNFFDNFSDNSMRTDIVERDSDYRVICDMPGVDKKNINISLNNNRLEIYGERNEGYDQDESSDQTVHRQERYFGSYTRRLLLPEDAVQEMSNIKAKCENGVLTVTIPKSQRPSRNRYNINIE